MEEFACLVHSTSVKNYEKMLKTGKILTYRQATSQKVNFGTGMGASYGDSDDDQFPGVYFSIKYIGDMIGPSDEDKELIGDGPYETVSLVFPIDLMTRTKNWHFNIRDRNGIMTYDTYFHFDIDTLPKRARDGLNECVMHDAVPINLVHTVVRDAQLVLKKPIHTSEPLDTETLPILFSGPDIYSGVEYHFYNRPDRTHLGKLDHRLWVEASGASHPVSWYADHPEKRSELNHKTFPQFLKELKSGNGTQSFFHHFRNRIPE